jgi:hypothetical protein
MAFGVNQPGRPPVEAIARNGRHQHTWKTFHAMRYGEPEFPGSIIGADQPIVQPMLNVSPKKLPLWRDAA